MDPKGARASAAEALVARRLAAGQAQSPFHVSAQAPLRSFSAQTFTLAQGVYWNQRDRRWRAAITGRQPEQLGDFVHETQAALAYDVAARELRRVNNIHRRLNFPSAEEAAQVERRASKELGRHSGPRTVTEGVAKNPRGSGRPFRGKASASEASPRRLSFSRGRRMGAREVRDAYAELHAVSLTLSFG